MIPLPLSHDRRLGDSRQAGVSLLEVLVAILVLSLGLLGLGSLQATSLRMNYSAYMRSHAAQAALDMADRMRANRQAALAGAYNISIGASAPDTSTLPKSEVNEWLTSELAALPAGDGSIAVNNATQSAVIIVEWDDRRAGVRGVNVDETPGNAATNARLMLSTQL